MHKIILVTGGGRGIGAATAILAAAQGYAVCVNYRSDQSAADNVVHKIRSKGGKAIAVRADVAVESEVVKLFETIDQQLGQVTSLVNNAGILERQSTVSKLDGERLHRIFATNVFGPFYCSREAIRRMSTRSGGKGGAIVNVSSTAIKHGAPFEYVDYASSKGALETFTLGLAKEVAEEGIRVNAVRAGTAYTDIHASGGEAGRVDRVKSTIPMKRGAQPEEIAQGILWLLSDEASYCAGSILDISGGR